MHEPPAPPPLPEGAVARAGCARLTKIGWASFFPGGGDQLLTLSGVGNQVRIWDIRTGGLVRVIPCPTEVQNFSLVAADLHEDGDHMVLAARGAGVRVLSLASGEMLAGAGVAEEPRLQGTTGVALLPDGESFLSLTRYYMAKGEKIFVRHRLTDCREISRIEVDRGGGKRLLRSPDGLFLATLPWLRLLRTEDLEWVSMPDRLSGTHWDGFAFHPSKPWFACSSDERGVEIWSYSRGRFRLLNRPVDEGRPSYDAVAFSPDGRRLAISGNWTETVILRVRGWEEITRFRPGANSLLYSPDGRSLLLSNIRGFTSLFDAESGVDLLPEERLDERLFQADFSPDGSRMAISGKKTISLIEVSTGAVLRRDEVPEERNYYAHDFELEGRGAVTWIREPRPEGLVLSGEGRAEWFASGGNVHGYGRVLSPDRELEVSHGGETLEVHATGVEQGWETWIARVHPEGGTETRSPAVSADSRFLVLGMGTAPPFHRGSLICYELPDLTEPSVLEEIDGSVRSVDISPNGRLVAGASVHEEYEVGRWAEFHLWDLRTQQRMLELRKGPIGSFPVQIAFHPTGALLCLLEENPAYCGVGQLHLVEIHTEQGAGTHPVYHRVRSRSFGGHLDVVTGFRFSPDGSRIASFGQDGTVLIWDVEKLMEEASG